MHGVNFVFTQCIGNSPGGSDIRKRRQFIAGSPVLIARSPGSGVGDRPGRDRGETEAVDAHVPIGRHRLRYYPYFLRTPMSDRGEPLKSTWETLYKTAYTINLGWRLRRIREGRHLTQGQVISRASRPNGRGYSQALLSRIEAGYANAPLYVYVHLAEVYDLDPGRLMGPEESDKPVGEAELALIDFLRRLGIRPAEAMAHLARLAPRTPGRRE